MAGLLIFVGETAVELDPMATVKDVRKEVKLAVHRKLFFQGSELKDDDQLLADLGIGSECRIEIGTGSATPIFHTDLPHQFTKFDCDNRQATFDSKTSDATCVFGREPIVSGLAWWFQITKSPQGSYYGVGLSPIPEDPQVAEKTRIANDGNGIGWSFNRNGCCYGPWKKDPMAGMSEGRDPGLLEGDFVRFEVSLPDGKVLMEHHMGSMHGDKKGEVRKKEGSIGQVTQPLHPAVFFCNKPDSRIRFVESQDDDHCVQS